MRSLWTETTGKPGFECLKRDITADVLIVGGGMAGLLCAYKLKTAGVDCVLLEAGHICGGVTENTTAKITSQHGAIYHKLINKFGVESARGYLDANEKALSEYRTLCKSIDCDFEEKDAFVYSKDDPRVIEKELRALDAIGYPATYKKGLPLPFPTAGAVRFSRQAQFHPLKFAYVLAGGLRIFENTKVLELAPHAAVTANGTVRAKNIIVATHFPFLNKHGMYFLKMYQHRSYVLGLENAPNVAGMYVDEDDAGLSFRNFGGLLLLGGGGHRTGEKGGSWHELEKVAKHYYPGAEERYQWATQDCMTLDDMPYIGRYSKSTDGLYVATGFNKWGMTSSMVAANLLCDLILERPNPYAELFSPSRSMLHPRLASNAAKSALHLLTPTAPRCPHLGCALKYNREEHSWDCPCHGSRFSEDGKRLDGPATGDKHENFSRNG